MKIRILFFVLIGFLFASCATSVSPIPTQIPISTSSVTQTPTLVLTPTPPVADTLTPAFTPKAVPTLPEEDARKRMLDLLANNGGCQLPCLWGIMPGKSTSQEAQVIWSPLSSIQSIYDIKPSFGPKGGYISPDFVEGDLILHTEVSYLSDNQIVSQIAFQAKEIKKFTISNSADGILDIFDSTAFGNRIKYYSIQNVLSELGIPSSVMIVTHRVPVPKGGDGGFDILLLYPDQGILVNYTMQGYLVGSNMRGCPTNAHVEMELYPPGNADSFFALLEKTDWAVKKNWYKPLEDVTSMSVDEFYQTFRQLTNKCIDTSIKLWPTPQPGGE